MWNNFRNFISFWPPSATGQIKCLTVSLRFTERCDNSACVNFLKWHLTIIIWRAVIHCRTKCMVLTFFIKCLRQKTFSRNVVSVCGTTWRPTPDGSSLTVLENSLRIPVDINSCPVLSQRVGVGEVAEVAEVHSAPIFYTSNLTSNRWSNKRMELTSWTILVKFVVWTWNLTWTAATVL
jgi:hypothetical protein